METRAAREKRRAEWPDRKRRLERERMDKRMKEIREGARRTREASLAAGTHPSQQADRERYVSLRVPLTGSQLADLQAAARKEGLTTGEYVASLITK